MIVNSEFQPARFTANRHVQTFLPTLLRRNSSVNSELQQLTLPDGDFLDVAWNKIPAREDKKPIVVIFHGLEGSINSPYAKGLMHALEQHGWHAVLMHFRNCSERVNLAARTYHSGETEDAGYFLEWLRKSYPQAPLFAVGYSMGGNMLLKLLGEKKKEVPLTAAVAVSVPLLMHVCADQMRCGFSKIYQHHLLQKMKRKLLRKFPQYDYRSLIGLREEDVKSIRDFWEFDSVFTAPINGFDSAYDYYIKSSSRQYLAEIKIPTLIIQSVDDPFMTPEVLPQKNELSDSVCLELSEKGGHVGFVSGRLWKPQFWLEERIPQYFSTIL
jgi:predicted alpha/beta-fold hydrolase